MFVVSVSYVERGHMPSPWSGHCSRQGEWSGVLCLLCALFMWRKATPPLHTALSIAPDKENGQVCCVCCVHRLCGERWHMDSALDMHLVICRK